MRLWYNFFFLRNMITGIKKIKLLRILSCIRGDYQKNFKRIALKCILSCFSTALYADPLNVETLPLARTMHYQKTPYDKIMIFSAPRTGSTIVYNIFRFLFENPNCLSFPHNEFRLDRSVLKTHKITEIEILKQHNQATLYVITVRHPIQASLSTYRIRTQPVANLKTVCKNLIQRQVKYFTFISELQQAGYPVILLRFEDFEKEPVDFLSNWIESHFHLSIAAADLHLLKEGYNRKNIHANIQSFIDFKQFFPLSGFHGEHVPVKQWAPSEELLYWLHHFYEKAKPIFQKYGY